MMPLEATRDRLGSQKITRAEHKRVTACVLEGTPAQVVAALEEWGPKFTPAGRAKKQVERVQGVPDAGPMWIPGAAPPPMAA